ncbi:MAG: hypothetical protein MI784_12830 [Cytophagales bacterium]|nr:hypothetical protein [Cytophagales bacterium]
MSAASFRLPVQCMVSEPDVREKLDRKGLVEVLDRMGLLDKMEVVLSLIHEYGRMSWLRYSYPEKSVSLSGLPDPLSSSPGLGLKSARLTRSDTELHRMRAVKESVAGSPQPIKSKEESPVAHEPRVSRLRSRRMRGTEVDDHRRIADSVLRRSSSEDSFWLDRSDSEHRMLAVDESGTRKLLPGEIEVHISVTEESASESPEPPSRPRVRISVEEESGEESPKPRMKPNVRISVEEESPELQRRAKGTEVRISVEEQSSSESPETLRVLPEEESDSSNGVFSFVESETTLIGLERESDQFADDERGALAGSEEELSEEVRPKRKYAAFKREETAQNRRDTLCQMELLNRIEKELYELESLAHREDVRGYAALFEFIMNLLDELKREHEQLVRRSIENGWEVWLQDRDSLTKEEFLKIQDFWLRLVNNQTLLQVRDKFVFPSDRKGISDEGFPKSVHTMHAKLLSHPIGRRQLMDLAENGNWPVYIVPIHASGEYTGIYSHAFRGSDARFAGFVRDVNTQKTRIKPGRGAPMILAVPNSLHENRVSNQLTVPKMPLLPPSPSSSDYESYPLLVDAAPSPKKSWFSGFPFKRKKQKPEIGTTQKEAAESPLAEPEVYVQKSLSPSFLDYSKALLGYGLSGQRGELRDELKNWEQEEGEHSMDPSGFADWQEFYNAARIESVLRLEHGLPSLLKSGKEERAESEEGKDVRSRQVVFGGRGFYDRVVRDDQNRHKFLIYAQLHEALADYLMKDGGTAYEPEEMEREKLAAREMIERYEEAEFREEVPVPGFDFEWRNIKSIKVDKDRNHVCFLKDFKGQELVVKLINFNREIGREAFASNFIRKAGSNVTAPKACVKLADGNEGMALRNYFEELDLKRKEKIGMFVQRLKRYRGGYIMIMEKMSGKNLFDERRNQILTKYLTSSHLRALGELSFYDLMLGNGDRLAIGLNTGNFFMRLQSPYVVGLDQAILPHEMSYFHERYVLHVKSSEDLAKRAGAKDPAMFFSEPDLNDWAVLAIDDRALSGTSQDMMPEQIITGKTAIKADQSFTSDEIHAYVNRQSQIFREIFESILSSYLKGETGCLGRYISELFQNEFNIAVPIQHFEEGFMEAVLGLLEHPEIFNIFFEEDTSLFQEEADFLMKNWMVVVSRLMGQQNREDLERLREKVGNSQAASPGRAGYKSPVFGKREKRSLSPFPGR